MVKSTLDYATSTPRKYPQVSNTLLIIACGNNVVQMYNEIDTSLGE